jgi:predicted nucleic acid-binding protein
MVLVDSTVWIDFFNGVDSWQVDVFDNLLDRELIAVGDLIVTEVLQGFRAEKDYRIARELMMKRIPVDLGGFDTAIAAARNFRFLRSKGITVRKTIDTLIATACIRNGWRLLHDDRDFDAFAEHLSLLVVGQAG